jgi:hypothetical protein
MKRLLLVLGAALLTFAVAGIANHRRVRRPSALTVKSAR